jgi:hypothetical protein
MTSRGFSDWHPVDRRGTSGDDYLAIVDMPQGDNIVDFEFSPERPENTAADARDAPTIIIQHNILKDLNAPCASTLMVPFQAFRINVKRYTGGTITGTVVQGGLHGN